MIKMRSVFPFIIALLFLNASTELHQFLRIPLLFKHYRYHHSENSSLSFLDFLQLHYTDRHPDDNDDEEDNKLPFKAAGDINHTDVSIALINEPIKRPFIYYSGKLWPNDTRAIPDNKANLIFHPPRISYC